MVKDIIMLAQISQNGIFVLYQNGIIMSRAFEKKGDKNEISSKRVTKRTKNISIKACA